MIGSSMVLGIIASVAANPCLASGASVVLESFDEGRRPARAQRRVLRDSESDEHSMGILRIVHASALE